jgi:hypothetical protein
MSLSGLLLGLINVGIIVAILMLVGAVIVWIMGLLQFAIPWQVQRIYMAVVALIALYMIVALLLGVPTIHFIDGRL